MGGNRLLMTWSREDWGGPWGPWGPWGEETESQAVAIGAHNVPHLDSTLTVRVTLTIYTKCAAHFDKVPQWVFHTYPMCHNIPAKCASSICPNWHALCKYCATVPLYHTMLDISHKKCRAEYDIKCITHRWTRMDLPQNSSFITRPVAVVCQFCNHPFCSGTLFRVWSKQIVKRGNWLGV